MNRLCFSLANIAVTACLFIAATASVQVLTFTPNVFTDPDVSAMHHVNTADGHIITTKRLAADFLVQI